MKKLLYLFLTVLIVACSGDDSNNSNNNSNNASLITPPAWIQGEWINETLGFGYTFTPDDFCITFSSNQSSTCYKAQIDLYADVPNISTGVEQIISNEFYAIEITIGPNIYNYDGFEKISATEFRYAPTGNETDDIAIYTKQ